MKEILDSLFRLQNVELGTEKAVPGSGKEELRQKVPGQILEQYDRLRGRGKKGIAFCRNGVCGQCHMQLAVGVFALLKRQDNLVRCQNCGAYLKIVEEAPVIVPVLEMPPRATKPGRRGRPPKAAAAHAA